MFKKTLTLMLGVIFFSPVALSFPGDDQFKKRCDDDSLTPYEAIQRNKWAKKCGHISRRDYDYYTYDDDGKLRARPKYPSFYNRASFNDWFKAPITENAACGIRHYTHKLFCVSSEPTPEQRAILLRCDDDSLTPSEAIQRNQWARKCRYISRRDYDYNVYDDNDAIRARPIYPSFSNPNNFDDWFKAPKIQNAPCDMRHYTKKLYCVSSAYY
ncbi:hypothetical protein BS333_13995 [Vibrio azureus]|uniref:Uncharacterized protein n=1 Tax=Vibrio azureus NBRC 104587 TaxID=1219077 RepID=U3AL47_9VIBR|nr:hypothetical protein [Vibrio azureus]AUI87527.1 hypothetical protein BS333_13995 [Vibrio azureus]GAD74495.1 hypothetical protein VAZ01S_011_00230 [Vibrio azureus NBRC 104587]